MKENIFKTQMETSSVFESGEYKKIINRGLHYFADMERSMYLELSKYELKSFLEDAYSKQSDDGMFRLLDDERMPSDIRQITWYKPTYAVCVVSVYAFVNYPDLFSEELKAKFKKLLDIAFGHGIVEHGGFEGTALTLLLSLIKAGCRKFIEENRDFSAVFTEVIERRISRLAEIAGSDKTFYQHGDFSETPVNARAKQIVAAWNGKDTAVFVYGTLKRKENAADLLCNSVFGGYYKLSGYKLIDLGSYPGIIESEKGTVLGEVYYVDKQTLESLDRYESNGSLYNRETLTVSGELGRTVAEVYVYADKEINAEFCGEYWNLKDSDYVWYAAYGSNLDPVRFSCYILGGKLTGSSKLYTGCADKTLWNEDKTDTVNGKVYFANSSTRWNGKGVAFFDGNGREKVFVHKYKITFGQLKGVWSQEGNGYGWYDSLLCLGISKDGCPVYTITSSGPRPANKPDEAYLKIIENALEKEFNLSKREISRYLKTLMP